MPFQSVYIDSNMLIFYYDKKGDMGRVSRQTIKKVIDNLDNSEIHVRIPQVILGEVLLYFCIRRKPSCEPSEITGLLKKLEADYPSSSLSIMRCAQELLTIDHSIKPNDALLVSHALLDRSTRWLLTADQILITNLEIKKKMDSMGHRFTIASTFHLV
jgi:predicted nucleic acid-binding protein